MDRRGQLVTSAIRALAREGVPHSTTRAIAAEAGVNIATLHYHFGGKDQLVAAVMSAVSAQHAEVFRLAIPTDGGLEDGLIAGLHRVLEFVRETQQLQLLQYELTTSALRWEDPEAGAEMVTNQYDAYLHVTRQVLQEILAESGQRIAVPVEDLAAWIVTGLDGLFLQTLVSTRGDRMLELFLEATLSLADPQPPMRTLSSAVVRTPRTPRRRRA
jgi:AcrR family transcriptional regulator